MTAIELGDAGRGSSGRGDAGLGDTGQTSVPLSGPTTVTLDEGRVRMTGIQALVRVLIDQGRQDARDGLRTGGFVSGYPGSPIGGLHNELGRHETALAELDVHHSPGVNEELAATAVWGAQTVENHPDARVDGVFGLWYGKAPGVDRAGDALRHGAIRGTARHGGVLVVAGDDPHANATVFPTDSTTTFQAWGMPVLYPGSTQEVIDLGLHGYALSRLSGLWVGFKMTTAIADGTGTADVGPGRIVPKVPQIEVDGEPFEPRLRVDDIGPGLRPAERDLRDGRRRLAAAYIRENNLNPVTVDPESAVVGIVGAGKSYHDVRQALSNLGLDEQQLLDLGIRVKKVSALFPVDRDEWREFARGLSRVIVVEEKVAFLETAIRTALYDVPDHPVIVGKHDTDDSELLPEFDEYTADLVAAVVHGQLTKDIADLPPMPPVERPRTLLPVLPSNPRAGFFCSGCPHNTSLQAPEGATVGTGIGCHTMALIVPRPEHGNVVGFTQMGGEGAQWIGQHRFVDEPHIFQNLGDGTYHHSGSLAVRAAIASGVNITYKLLYNDVVGMTGGQEIRGLMAVPELVTELLAEGVGKIIVTTDDPKKYRRTRLPKGVQVWDRDRIVEAQERLAEVPGVTVLIHDQHCAADRRRLIRRGAIAEPTTRVFIHERVCEGCGDCNRKSECLSVQPVETPFGRKTTIHQSSCNFDYSCTRGDCPSFLTISTKSTGKPTTRAVADPPITLTEPQRPDATRWSIHITGIGGTGVLSAGQVLSAAAGYDGLASRGLDLTGSAIKAGPVISQVQLFPADDDAEPAAAIAAGRADVYLGFDLLAAMRPEALAPLGSGTIAIGSTTQVPTARMAFDSSTPYPSDLRSTIDGLTRRDRNVYVDAEAVALELFGTHLAANSLLLGVAYQSGALPIRAESMERAFESHGVAVEQNVAAFRWGRAIVLSPDLAGDSRRPTGAGVLEPRVSSWIDAVEPGDGLREDLELRVPDLLDYQNAAYVRRYLARVRDAVREERRRGVTDESISRAVATFHYKLLAYKDEYEVARLMLQPAPRLAAEFGPDAKVTWNLHPPMLRALGMRKKIALGPWFRPAFVALRSMRRVRGHWFDPFGRAALRRLERALVVHYERLNDLVWALPDGTAPELLVEFLSAPELVRGYEHVKVAHVERYLDHLDTVAAQAGIADPVTEIAAEVRTLLGRLGGAHPVP